MNKEELIRAVGELFVEKLQLEEQPTNGEVIKAMFPDEVGYSESTFCIYYGTMRFLKKWWNSPYKKE